MLVWAENFGGWFGLCDCNHFQTVVIFSLLTSVSHVITRGLLFKRNKTRQNNFQYAISIAADNSLAYHSSENSLNCHFTASQNPS